RWTASVRKNSTLRAAPRSRFLSRLAALYGAMNTNMSTPGSHVQERRFVDADFGSRATGRCLKAHARLMNRAPVRVPETDEQRRHERILLQQIDIHASA